MASIINASSSGSGGIVQTADASGVLQLQSNGTVALTINSGGSALSIGPYTNSSSGTFNGTLQIGSNLQLMSYASGSNTQTQLASNTYYNAGYKAIAGGAGASKLFVGGAGTFELSGSAILTNAGDAITFTPTLACNGLGYTVYLQGGATTATGTGISFPATQSASSDANTLDDYEEGTWTPANATVSVTSPAGRYIKIGKLVTVIGQWTYPSTASGNPAEITGLPFNVVAYGGNYAGTTTITSYGSDNLYPFTLENTTKIAIRNNTNTDIFLSSVSAKFINFMASYITDN